MKPSLASEPFHLHVIAPTVAHVRYVHRAITVAVQVNQKSQNMIRIALRVFLGDHLQLQRIQHPKQTAAFCRIVCQRVGYDGIAQTAFEILKMPTVLDTLRIDIITLDLIRPIGIVDHPLRT